MKFKLLFIFSLFILEFTRGQINLKPYKIGLLYNTAANENFLNNDPDYTYATKTFKAQAFYKLPNWKSFQIELIVQPQIQFLEHQLLNEQFVLPSEENYLVKRNEFTQLKEFNLYGIEFGFVTKKIISKKLNVQLSASLGFAIIDTRTERLAKGFTFIENFSIGFSYNFSKKSHLYIGSNIFGHVSNLNFQKPNNGYNIMGVEIGYSIEL